MFYNNPSMAQFNLQAPFKPTGDQPEAIAQLIQGIKKGYKQQVLLGATGTGKTYTMANVIEAIQKPTLVLAHNKTLVAQLYAEFKEFFPDNAVEFFTSYYDYYQPEAYVPRNDLYIEKETDINEEIERLRQHADRDRQRHVQQMARNRALAQVAHRKKGTLSAQPVNATLWP